MLAATVNFDFEFEPVAFVEAGKARTFDRRDVNKRIGLSVIALNETEALHRVEEFHGAAGFFTRQFTTATAATFARCIAVTRGATVSHGQGFAIDLEVGRRNLAAAVHQGEPKRLSFGQAGQAGLLDRRDVNEHIFAAIIANDKAKALLPVEEFYNAGAFANDLCRHATTGTTAAATEAAATTAAAETTATAAAAESVAATAAKAITTTTEAITAAAEAAAITAAAAATTFIAKAITLVASASAAIPAATLIETHAVLYSLQIRPPVFKKYHAPDAGIIFSGAMSQCAK
jgi:hypothetical protein